MCQIVIYITVESISVFLNLTASSGFLLDEAGLSKDVAFLSSFLPFRLQIYNTDY